MADNDVLKTIQEKEADFGNLFTRMDDDRKLFNLDTFSLKDTNGRAYDNVHNVTMNDPQTLAFRIMTVLNSASPQRVVKFAKTTQQNDKKAALVEDFLADIFEEIDERLELREIEGLHPFAVEQACLRGRIGARCVIRWDGDTFVPDILPADMRYVTYEYGASGLKWACYTTTRTSDQIEEEYQISLKNDSATVRDYWNTTSEMVFIDHELRVQNEHDSGYVPWSIARVPMGSMLQDSDVLKYTGESIFASNRSLYSALNTIASIFYTNEIGLLLKPAMQYESDAGELGNPPDQPLTGEGYTVPVEKGAGFKLMPHRDVSDGAMRLYSMVEQRLQRGGLPAVDYGNLTFPLSAVAISRLTETRDAVYLPRLQALSKFYLQLARMIIKQYIDGKFKADLGKTGKKRSYAASDIDGEYSIGFQFNVVSPEQNIANYSVAQAALPFRSMRNIREEILQLEDPAEEEELILSEQADKAIPELTMYKMARAKLENGEDLEALLIAKKLGVTIQQLLSGNIAPEGPQPQPEPKGKPMLPLLGEGKRRASTAAARGMPGEAPPEQEV